MFGLAIQLYIDITKTDELCGILKLVSLVSKGIQIILLTHSTKTDRKTGYGMLAHVTCHTYIQTCHVIPKRCHFHTKQCRGNRTTPLWLIPIFNPLCYVTATIFNELMLAFLFMACWVFTQNKFLFFRYLYVNHLKMFELD